MKRAIVTTDILEEKLDYELSNHFTGFLGLIDSYSKINRTAKVQPLGKIKTRQGLVNLPVVNLPVSTHFAGGIEIIPSYQKGDLVYCAPNLVPTYNQLRGRYEINYSRKNKLENLIVVCGLSKQPSSLNPMFNKEGLIITDNVSMYAQFSDSKIELKLGSSKITIESNKITLDANVVIKGKLDVDSEITWNNASIKTTASTHTHATGVGPSSSPTAGS